MEPIDQRERTHCACACHRHFSNGPHIVPALDDPLETLLACSKCRWRHYPPPKYEPPTGKKPWTDTDDTD